MTNQFVEDTLNKLADVYENRFEGVVYFNTEEKELAELQKKETVELPVFVFGTTNAVEDNKLVVPVIGIVSKGLREDFIKETLIKYTPKRLKGCKVQKLKNSDFTITEKSEFISVNYNLEFLFN